VTAGPSRTPAPLAANNLPMRRFAFFLPSVLALACCNNAPPPEAAPQPAPEKPPTPASVTKDNPGGDAADPVKAALQRLLNEPIEAKRKDRWGTLRVPLADWKNWRRIKITGHPTRATFQYGDEHIAMTTLRYSQIEGANDPERCLAEFVKFATPIAEGYGIRIGQSKLVNLSQSFRGEARPVLVRLQEGGVDSIFLSDDYVGFVAAYQSWPGTCLVQGFAVVSTNHAQLATQVRDRWVSEAVAKLTWERKVKEAPDPSQMR
jgi:hypothetical protein